MNVSDIKFPYYRNVPDKNGTLTVKKEWVRYADYVKYLHIDPIKHINMLCVKN